MDTGAQGKATQTIAQTMSTMYRLSNTLARTPLLCVRVVSAPKNRYIPGRAPRLCKKSGSYLLSIRSCCCLRTNYTVLNLRSKQRAESTQMRVPLWRHRVSSPCTIRLVESWEEDWHVDGSRCDAVEVHVVNKYKQPLDVANSNAERCRPSPTWALRLLLLLRTSP